eukprot:TRINITY_DN50601_c0_g1_i2.p3 TRINITY_DN50601_c0_g1~~TRINITY_DN50601_c0_g1_i2.p3  ORF type:complete len:102 (+),score=17.09 TRINITY_DN50601_c0_g1_i2:84-389(+)
MSCLPQSLPCSAAGLQGGKPQRKPHAELQAKQTQQSRVHSRVAAQCALGAAAASARPSAAADRAGVLPRTAGAIRRQGLKASRCQLELWKTRTLNTCRSSH